VSGLPSVGQSTVFIWQVCVHPDYRREGIALELLKLLFGASVKFGFNNIQLSIATENINSHKMFEKFSDTYSLKMEYQKQTMISGIPENVYKISKIQI